jgi:hypothetical protein
MDELIRTVVERTGISEEQARTAVETVIGFVKERLPEPIAGQVDSYLSGGGAGGGSLGDVAGKLGGMFGGE